MSTSKTIRQTLEHLQSMEITRSIIDNKTMKRLNIPAEILALESFVPVLPVELEINFRENTVTWRPKLTTLNISAYEEEEEEDEMEVPEVYEEE